MKPRATLPASAYGVAAAVVVLCLWCRFALACDCIGQDQAYSASTCTSCNPAQPLVRMELPCTQLAVLIIMQGRLLLSRYESKPQNPGCLLNCLHRVAQAIAEHMNVPVVRSEMILEGGSVHSDGEG